MAFFSVFSLSTLPDLGDSKDLEYLDLSNNEIRNISLHAFG